MYGDKDWYFLYSNIQAAMRYLSLSAGHFDWCFEDTG